MSTPARVQAAKRKASRLTDQIKQAEARLKEAKTKYQTHMRKCRVTGLQRKLKEAEKQLDLREKALAKKVEDEKRKKLKKAAVKSGKVYRRKVAAATKAAAAAERKAKTEARKKAAEERRAQAAAKKEAAAAAKKAKAAEAKAKAAAKKDNAAAERKAKAEAAKAKAAERRAKAEAEKAKKAEAAAKAKAAKEQAVAEAKAKKAEIEAAEARDKLLNERARKLGLKYRETAKKAADAAAPKAPALATKAPAKVIPFKKPSAKAAPAPASAKEARKRVVDAFGSRLLQFAKSVPELETETLEMLRDGVRLDALDVPELKAPAAMVVRVANFLANAPPPESFDTLKSLDEHYDRASFLVRDIAGASPELSSVRGLGKALGEAVRTRLRALQAKRNQLKKAAAGKRPVAVDTATARALLEKGTMPVPRSVKGGYSRPEAMRIADAIMASSEYREARKDRSQVARSNFEIGLGQKLTRRLTKAQPEKAREIFSETVKAVKALRPENVPEPNDGEEREDERESVEAINRNMARLAKKVVAESDRAFAASRYPELATLRGSFETRAAQKGLSVSEVQGHWEDVYETLEIARKQAKASGDAATVKRIEALEEQLNDEFMEKDDRQLIFGAPDSPLTSDELSSAIGPMPFKLPTLPPRPQLSLFAGAKVQSRKKAEPKTPKVGREDFEERREARIERLEDRAAKKQKEAAQKYEASKAAVAGIPMGQPILVGHHSEAKHRRDIERSHQAMGASVKAANEAARLKRAAEAAEANVTISSDDPEALTKLAKKLAAQVSTQNRLKEENKLIRSGKAEAELVERLNHEYRHWPAYKKGSGHPPGVLSNLSAQVRSTQKRINTLMEQAKRVAEKTRRIERGKYAAFEDPSINRVVITTSGKPSQERRRELKQSGFRYSPKAEGWVRMISEGAWHAAKSFVESFAEEDRKVVERNTPKGTTPEERIKSWVSIKSAPYRLEVEPESAMLRNLGFGGSNIEASTLPALEEVLIQFHRMPDARSEAERAEGQRQWRRGLVEDEDDRNRVLKAVREHDIVTVKALREMMNEHRLRRALHKLYDDQLIHPVDLKASPVQGGFTEAEKEAGFRLRSRTDSYAIATPFIAVSERPAATATKSRFMARRKDARTPKAGSLSAATIKKAMREAARAVGYALKYHPTELPGEYEGTISHRPDGSGWHISLVVRSDDPRHYEVIAGGYFDELREAGASQVVAKAPKGKPLTGAQLEKVIQVVLKKAVAKVFPADEPKPQPSKVEVRTQGRRLRSREDVDDAVLETLQGIEAKIPDSPISISQLRQAWLAAGYGEPDFKNEVVGSLRRLKVTLSPARLGGESMSTPNGGQFGLIRLRSDQTVGYRKLAKKKASDALRSIKKVERLVSDGEPDEARAEAVKARDRLQDHLSFYPDGDQAPVLRDLAKSIQDRLKSWEDQAYAARKAKRAASLESAQLEDRVRQAILGAADRGRFSLAAVRRRLGSEDYERAKPVLLAMHRRALIELIKVDDQVMTPELSAAALLVAGSPRHFGSIGSNF